MADVRHPSHPAGLTSQIATAPRITLHCFLTPSPRQRTSLPVPKTIRANGSTFISVGSTSLEPQFGPHMTAPVDGREGMVRVVRLPTRSFDLLKLDLRAIPYGNPQLASIWMRLLWLWTSKGRSGGDQADEMAQSHRTVSRAHEETCGRPEGSFPEGEHPSL